MCWEQGGCDGTQAPEQKNKVRETTLSAAHSCLPASISAVRCVRSGSHISPTQQKCRIWKNAAGTTPAANSNNRERAPLIPGVRVGENLLRYDFRFCSARSSLWHSTPPPLADGSSGQLTHSPTLHSPFSSHLLPLTIVTNPTPRDRDVKRETSWPVVLQHREVQASHTCPSPPRKLTKTHDRS